MFFASRRLQTCWMRVSILLVLVQCIAIVAGKDTSACKKKLSACERSLESTEVEVAELNAEVSRLTKEVKRLQALVSSSPTSEAVSSVKKEDESERVKAGLESPALNDLLKKHSSKVSKNVLLAVSNYAFVDFAMNMWWYLRKAKAHENVIIISLDAETYKFLRRKKIPTMYDPRRSTDSGAQEYHSPVFKDIQRLRLLYLLDALTLGYNVLLTDLDAVFFSDPFKSLSGQSEAYFASDAMDVDDYLRRPLRVMGGFFYVRATEANIQLILQTKAALANDAEADDQEALNNALFGQLDENGRSKGIDFSILDPAEFMNGGLYFFDQENLKPQRPKVVMVQNNFLIGTEQKRMRFRAHGLWKVPNSTLKDSQYLVIQGMNGLTLSEQRSALRCGLAISRVLGRILVLPQVRKRSPFGEGMEEGLRAGLQMKVYGWPTKMQEANTTVETYFDYEEMVKRFSVSDSAALNSLDDSASVTVDIQGGQSLQVDASFTPKNARHGATSEELKDWLQSYERTPVLKIASCVDSFFKFDDNVAQKAFSNDVAAALRPNEWIRRASLSIVHRITPFSCLHILGRDVVAMGWSAIMAKVKKLVPVLHKLYVATDIDDIDDLKPLREEYREVHNLRHSMPGVDRRWGATEMMMILDQNVCSEAQFFVGRKKSLSSRHLCFFRRLRDRSAHCVYLDGKAFPTNADKLL